MNNSEMVMKVFFLLCFLAFRLISTGMAHAKKKRKENKVKISKRKRLIILKEMAQRGFTQKYYTHPLYTEVEKTIKRYVKIMKNGKGELSYVAQIFLLKMVENELLFEQLPSFMTRQRPGRYFLKAVEHFYAEKAIRPIKEWQPEPEKSIFDNALYLIAFLFEHYPVPRHFSFYWLFFSLDKRVQAELNALIEGPKESSLNGAYFDLYFHLAKGLNVRSWKPLYFKPSKKEAHIWMNSLKNTNLNLLDAFWTSVYRARGGKAFEHLLINVPMSLKQLDFWRQFIDLMIKEEQKKEPKLEGISELIHLIQWVKFGEKRGLYNFTGMEQIRNSQPELSLKREHLSSLRRKVYHDIQAEYTLPVGFREKYVFTGPNGQLFQIKHLKNRWELQKEAAAMGNCLDDWGYHLKAINGNSHFWSLRSMDSLPESRSLVSIEIADSAIVEFQAEKNSSPEQYLMEIMEQWAEENRLTIAAYEENY
jgi:hypothetical protein